MQLPYVDNSKLKEYMALPHAGPFFEHDCDECTFLGAYMIEHRAYDLYAHVTSKYRGSLIARFGSGGEHYLSTAVFSGAQVSCATWAQIATTLADYAIEADRTDGIELISGLPVRYPKMHFGSPVTILAGSKEHHGVLQTPKVGDLIWTNPAPDGCRTVSHVHGVYMRMDDGRHIYTIEDNRGKGHEVRRVLVHGETLYWCTGHHG